MSVTGDRIIDAVLAEAVSKVGLKESPKGSNSGAALEAYLKNTGFRPGNAWCDFFVTAVGRYILGKNWPLPGNGSCDTCLNFARKNGILYSTPLVGDIFLSMANQYDATHTGFVYGGVSGGGDGDFETVEGNSNGGGSREGWCVVRRPDRVTDPSGRYFTRFVRWRNLVAHNADILNDTLPFPRPGEGSTGTAPKYGPEWKIWVGSNSTPIQGWLSADNRVYVGVRDFLEEIYGEGEVNAGLARTDAGLLTWRGRLMGLTPEYRGGHAYGWVREVAAGETLNIVSVNKAGREVHLARGEAVSSNGREHD